MRVSDIIKKLKEDKGLMKNEVYNEIRLIDQLNDKNKTTIMNIIDTILPK